MLLTLLYLCFLVTFGSLLLGLRVAWNKLGELWVVPMLERMADALTAGRPFEPEAAVRTCAGNPWTSYAIDSSVILLSPFVI